MPIIVRQIVEQLNSVNSESVMCLAVEGFEDAALSARIVERDGKVLLHLSAESELAEILTEIDIIR